LRAIVTALHKSEVDAEQMLTACSSGIFLVANCCYATNYLGQASQIWYVGGYKHVMPILLA
jgi:hypothetical protein